MRVNPHLTLCYETHWQDRATTIWCCYLVSQWSTFRSTLSLTTNALLSTMSSVNVGRGRATAATTSDDTSPLRDPTAADLMTLDLPHSCTTFSVQNKLSLSGADYNYDSSRLDGRSTACCQRSLRSQWRYTGRWPASRSHADLFIYLRLSAAIHNYGLTIWPWSVHSKQIRNSIIAWFRNKSFLHETISN